MNMFVGIKIGDCLKEIKWKYYYRYKPIFDEDVEGKYTFIQRCLLFLKITKVNLFGDYLTPNLLKDKVEMSPDMISNIILKALSSDKPCMVARFGANEQRITANYISIKRGRKQLVRALCGRQPFWWWDKQVRREFTVGNLLVFYLVTSDFSKIGRLLLRLRCFLRDLHLIFY